MITVTKDSRTFTGNAHNFELVQAIVKSEGHILPVGTHTLAYLAEKIAQRDRLDNYATLCLVAYLHTEAAWYAFINKQPQPSTAIRAKTWTIEDTPGLQRTEFRVTCAKCGLYWITVSDHTDTPATLFSKLLMAVIRWLTHRNGHTS